MRGMGRRSGSKHRGSFDHVTHKGSLADQDNQRIHGEHDSETFTSPPAPQRVISTPVVLHCPLVSSAGNAFVGSSSLSISTPCHRGGTTPDNRSIDPTIENP